MAERFCISTQCFGFLRRKVKIENFRDIIFMVKCQDSFSKIPIVIMKNLERVEITKNTFPVQIFQLFMFSFFSCRSQEDSKSRFSKTKSLRDKFRESKTWSLRRSVEKESSPVQTTSNHSSNQCDKNGNNDHHSSTTSLSSSKYLKEENAGR